MNSTKFEPRKLIVTQEDLKSFENSQCRNLILSFLDSLNSSVVGKRRSSEIKQNSAAIEKLLNLLQKCRKSVEMFPREEATDSVTNSRFGHPQFRAYYCYLDENLSNWISNLFLSKKQQIFTLELKTLFLHCFGDRQRIDYGTGHEFHFIVFLYCLKELQVFSEKDFPLIVLQVFWSYIEWMHLIQKTYWLEPAGSHGVWGLDDYQFLCFYFGSAQLVGHKYIKPKSIHNQEILDEFQNDYLYLYCVNHVNKVKSKASLSWHSPMLNDISAVKEWSKVNSGLMKMFCVEVLGKLPIMQHLLFGRLFGALGCDSATEEEKVEFFKTVYNVSGESPLAFTMPQYEQFIPPSVLQAHNSHSSIQSFHNHHDLDAIAEEEEEYVEQVVKYVKNPKGGWIPIKGRVLKGTPVLPEPDENSNVDPSKPILLDSYAMGQAPPICCGIRIPSAHAQAPSGRSLMPHD